MQKQIVLACIVMSIAFTSYAQVTVSIPAAASSEYTLHDLAQISMNNISGQAIPSCYVEITCTEDNGNKVFEMKTPVMNLNAGNNMLGYSALTAAQSTGFSSKFNVLEQTGAFPNGKYTICASVYKAASAQQIGTTCSFIESKDISGLYLLSPSDEAVIETEYPNFNWMNTDLRGNDKIVKYAIKICELYSYQNYAEAIGSNPPLVYDQDVNSNSYTYPGSAPVLDKDKKYVWQIEASVTFGGNVTKTYSEIWMFQFSKPRPAKPTKKKPEKDQFAYLSKTLSGSTYAFDRRITIRYDNESNDSLLNYTISETGSDKQVMSPKEKPVVLKPGVNYIILPVTKEMSRKPFNKQGIGGSYIMEVNNSRQENWKIKFVLVKPKKEDNQ